MALSFVSKHFIPGLGSDKGNFSHHHLAGIEKLDPFVYLRKHSENRANNKVNYVSSIRKTGPPQSPHSQTANGRVRLYSMGKAKPSPPRYSQTTNAAVRSFVGKIEPSMNTGRRRQLAAPYQHLKYELIAQMLDSINPHSINDLHDPSR